MIHRILDICQEGRYLSVSRGFLQVKSGADVLGQVPLDDIGSLLVSSHDTVLSKNVLNALAERGCPTYLCAKNYAPLSVVLPIAAHFHATKVLKDQISCTKEAASKASLAKGGCAKDLAPSALFAPLRKRKRL